MPSPKKLAASLTLAYFLVLLAVVPMLVSAADALEQPAIATPTGAVPVEVISLHDADTLRVNVLLPFGVTLRNKSIRAFGYDAWEISRTRQTVKVNASEIEKGKAAKAALEQLIATGTLYVVESGEADPYGRTSAWLYVRTKAGDWISVAAWMEKEGHCRK